MDTLEQNPILIDVPMPVHTPRLLIRPKQAGDGALTAAAVTETWDDLHRWMSWAENLADHSADKQEIRTRQVMASFLLREELNLLGVEIRTGQPVVGVAFTPSTGARACAKPASGYAKARSATASQRKQRMRS